MTATFFKGGTTVPDFDFMIEFIKKSEDIEPIAEIAFICKVVTARALDQLSKK